MAGAKRIAHPQRFEIYWVGLDPAVGHEVQKTRPCVIISPDSLNAVLKTVIIAPVTSKPKYYSSRVPLMQRHIKGEVMLDQMRCIDKSRLRKLAGMLDKQTAEEVLLVLAEMFAP